MKKIYPKIVKKGFSLTKSAKIGVAIGTTAMATSVLGGVAYAANTNPSGPPAKGIVSSCSVTGVQDECNAAINYANAHYGGSGKTTILKIEADTEAHGGTTTHEVFDIRLQAPNGSIYVVHVLRNENNDSVWWSNLAENQSATSSSTSSSTTPSSTSSSSSSGSSPDHSSSTAPSSSGSSPDHSSSSSSTAPSSGGNDTPQISASQANTIATNFAQSQGDQVLGVKHTQLNSNGQKDYYQVKLQLGSNGNKSGTVNVWVDATSSSGVVTAASGSGIQYRNPNIVSPATAQSNALATTGGGSVYKTQINGGKWKWYWVFVRNGSTKYKVGVSAASGVVTQSKIS